MLDEYVCFSPPPPSIDRYSITIRISVIICISMFAVLLQPKHPVFGTEFRPAQKRLPPKEVYNDERKSHIIISIRLQTKTYDHLISCYCPTLSPTHSTRIPKLPLLSLCSAQHQSAMYVKSLKYTCSLSVRWRGSFGGVNCAFSDVNSSSKFDTSSMWRCGKKERERDQSGSHSPTPSPRSAHSQWLAQMAA